MFIVTSSLANVQTQIALDILTVGGAFATISLILSASMAVVLVDSKYWNRWSSSTLDICTYPLYVVFAAIVVLKIMLVT
jgi:hypothetical protein